MKARYLVIFLVLGLLGCCLFPLDCLAFAQPIVRKANQLTENLLLIIRVSCILICLAILFVALTGRVNWKWILITVIVGVCVGPAWGPIKDFVGVRDDGHAAAQGAF